MGFEGRLDVLSDTFDINAYLGYTCVRLFFQAGQIFQGRCVTCLIDSGTSKAVLGGYFFVVLFKDHSFFP